LHSHPKYDMVSKLSHGESNDSTAEYDKREAETVDEDPTSTWAQFEEASITIRSHQVIEDTT